MIDIKLPGKISTLENTKAEFSLSAEEQNLKAHSGSHYLHFLKIGLKYGSPIGLL